MELTALPHDLARDLAGASDLGTIDAVVELRTGLRAAYGQTYLLRIGSHWIAAGRESVLDPFEIVPLRSGCPAVVERGEWEDRLALHGLSGERLRLVVSMLDREKLDRIEALIPQPARGSSEEETSERRAGGAAALPHLPPADEPRLGAPAEARMPPGRGRRAEAERPAPPASWSPTPPASGLGTDADEEDEGRATNPEGFGIFFDGDLDDRAGAEPLVSSPPPLPVPDLVPTWEREPNLGRRKLEEIEERVVRALEAGDPELAAEIYSEAMGAGPTMARHAVTRIATARGLSSPVRAKAAGSWVLYGVGVVALVLLARLCASLS